MMLGASVGKYSKLQLGKITFRKVSTGLYILLHIIFKLEFKQFFLESEFENEKMKKKMVPNKHTNPLANIFV